MKDDSGKAYHISLWAANTHHIIVFTLAFYFLMFPQACQDSSAFQWYVDEVCFVTVDKRHVNLSFFTAGYLAYDLYVMHFYIKGSSALFYQSLFHHIISLMGILAGSYTGYGAPGIGNICLMTEISTIFLNFREMYAKENLSQTIPSVLQVIFFILYTIFRMIGFPYGLYRLGLLGFYIWDKVGWFRQTCWGLTFTLYLLMMALNIYWYFLILKGVGKLLGIIKPKNNLLKEQLIQ